MQTNKLDQVPARLSVGEQVASNDALLVLGRKLIPAANKLAIKMNKLGAKKPGASAMHPPIGTDEPEPVDNAREEAGEFANGSTAIAGVQMPSGLPRLGAQLDTGNGVPGVGTAIPGAVRDGNSYAQATGFVPAHTNMTHQMGNGQPVQRFAFGMTNEAGAQQPEEYPAIAGFPDIGGAIKSGYGKFANVLNTRANGMRLVSPADNRPAMTGQGQGNLGAASDAVAGAGRYALDNIGRTASQVGDYFNQPAPAAALPQPIAQQQPGTDSTPGGNNGAQSQQSATPTLTDKGGTVTLSGDGFKVSSSSPQLGAFSSPESLSALGGQIAYNQTQGAKDQFAANAALTAGRVADGKAYDDNRAMLGRQAQLEQLAFGGDANQLSPGQMFAAKGQQKAAQGLLGRMDSRQSAQAKLQQDQINSDRSYGLEQQKANAPEFAAQDIYGQPDQFGEASKIGQKLYNKKTGETVGGNQADHADYLAQLKTIYDNPDLPADKKLEVVRRLQMARYGAGAA